MWGLVRGADGGTGGVPDLTQLQDFLLSDETATINVALGVGYVSILVQLNQCFRGSNTNKTPCISS